MANLYIYYSDERGRFASQTVGKSLGSKANSNILFNDFFYYLRSRSELIKDNKNIIIYYDLKTRANNDILHTKKYGPEDIVLICIMLDKLNSYGNNHNSTEGWKKYLERNPNYKGVKVELIPFYYTRGEENESCKEVVRKIEGIVDRFVKGSANLPEEKLPETSQKQVILPLDKSTLPVKVRDANSYTGLGVKKEVMDFIKTGIKDDLSVIYHIPAELYSLGYLTKGHLRLIFNKLSKLKYFDDYSFYSNVKWLFCGDECLSRKRLLDSQIKCKVVDKVYKPSHPGLEINVYAFNALDLFYKLIKDTPILPKLIQLQKLGGYENGKQYQEPNDIMYLIKKAHEKIKEEGTSEMYKLGKDANNKLETGTKKLIATFNTKATKTGRFKGGKKNKTAKPSAKFETVAFNPTWASKYDANLDTLINNLNRPEKTIEHLDKFLLKDMKALLIEYLPMRKLKRVLNAVNKIDKDFFDQAKFDPYFSYSDEVCITKLAPFVTPKQAFTKSRRFIVFSVADVINFLMRLDRKKIQVASPKKSTQVLMPYVNFNSLWITPNHNRMERFLDKLNLKPDNYLTSLVEDVVKLDYLPCTQIYKFMKGIHHNYAFMLDESMLESFIFRHKNRFKALALERLSQGEQYPLSCRFKHVNKVYPFYNALSILALCLNKKGWDTLDKQGELSNKLSEAKEKWEQFCQDSYKYEPVEIDSTYVQESVSELVPADKNNSSAIWVDLSKTNEDMVVVPYLDMNPDIMGRVATLQNTLKEIGGSLTAQNIIAAVLNQLKEDYRNYLISNAGSVSVANLQTVTRSLEEIESLLIEV